MRRTASFALGLGLALAFTASATAQSARPRSLVPSASHQGIHVGHMCADCASKLPQRIPAGSGPIEVQAQLQAAAVASNCVGCELSNPNQSGLAYVGMGSELYGQPAMGGYGMMSGTEPMPIGIMQTGYAAHSAHMPHAALATGHQAAAPSMANLPAAPMGVSSSSPGINRPALVSHVLGLPKLGGWSRAREARRREAHAAIRFDNVPSTVSSIPAAWVHGQR